MFSRVVRRSETFERPDECPKIRSDLCAPEQATKLISVGLEDILADVSRQMIVANELRHFWKEFGGSSDESVTKVVNDRQGQSPVMTYLREDEFDLCVVFRGDFLAFQDLAAQGVDGHEQDSAPAITGSIDMQDVSAT